MDSKIHALLSQIHDILSSHDPQDFLQASRSPGISSHIKNALLSLERERKHDGEDRCDDVDSGEIVRNTQDFPANSEVAHSTKANPSNFDCIVDLIMGCPRLRTKKDLRKFSKSLGVTIPIRDKDERVRVARKLAKVIAAGHPDFQKMAVRLLERAHDPQTQGWVDVIRNTK